MLIRHDSTLKQVNLLLIFPRINYEFSRKEQPSGNVVHHAHHALLGTRLALEVRVGTGARMKE